MSYHCLDCSYRGSSRGQGGACPGCGSFNVRLRKKVEYGETQGVGGKIRLALLVVLWSILISMIAWKLAH